MRRPALLGALVLIGIAAAGLAGCTGWSPGHHGSGSDASIAIVAPGDHTQVANDGAVDVTVRLDRSLSASTLRLAVIGEHHAPVDVTRRLHATPQGFSAALSAADLTPGVNRLVASARPRRHHGRGHSHRASTTISWEPAVDVALASRCDFLGQPRCALPFPNDLFTVARRERRHRSARALRRRDRCRRTVAGAHIDPTEWNRNDGFSPGAMILAYVPGVDLATTGAPPDHRHRSLASPPTRRSCCSTPTPASAGRSSPSSTRTPPPTRTAALIIRPARNLLEGHRYIVALRNLKDAGGATAAREPGVPALPRPHPDVHPGRRSAVAVTSSSSSRPCAARTSAASDLNLAWDFTVASERNLSGRMLHIRDDAFASLDGGGTAVHRHPGRGERRRRHPPARRRHVHRPELPDRHRRSRVAASTTRPGTPVPTGCRSATATTPPTSSASSRARRAPTATTRCTRHAAIGTATACSAARTRSTASGRSRTRATPSSAAPTRSACRAATSERRGHARRPRRTSPSSPTDCSRASSTCCSSPG